MVVTFAVIATLVVVFTGAGLSSQKRILRDAYDNALNAKEKLDGKMGERFLYAGKLIHMIDEPAITTEADMVLSSDDDMVTIYKKLDTILPSVQKKVIGRDDYASFLPYFEKLATIEDEIVELDGTYRIWEKRLRTLLEAHPKMGEKLSLHALPSYDFGSSFQTRP